MNLNIDAIKELKNLNVIAKLIVEGFITGLHKSPYHGFSVEFAEHKLYNTGESTRFIDWKVFAKTDCLTCGNCCRTTSPMWNDTDIQRVSHLFKMKTSAFLDAYLVQDSDGDWVYPAAPCPFLDLSDNKCGIYDHRPKACREYPHTDRKNIMGILGLTSKNALICPAVTQILEKIEQIYK